MKKALVLGVLAFFAINIATVQSVNAQDKKTVNSKETVDVKKDQQKANELKKENDNTTATPKTLGTDKKNNTTKTNTTTVKQEKGSVKAEKKDVKVERKEQPAKPQGKTVEVDNTKKNKNVNNTIPPKPVMKKEGTNNSNSKPAEK